MCRRDVGARGEVNEDEVGRVSRGAGLNSMLDSQNLSDLLAK